tara:strand:- start:3602 stop:3970 length:369 start_codon:yes stop_codon:yes gene_type:complete
MSFVSSDTIVGHPLSGSNKLVPAVKSQQTFQHVEIPAPAVSSSFHLRGARPHSVYVKDNKGQDVLFAFGAGIEGGPQGGWINFGDLTTTSSIGELHVNPVAWKLGGGSPAAGDVIFIYKGEN